jgi:hypothetical protein
MKLSLAAAVKSRMVLRQTLSLFHEGQEYIFHRAEDGTFDKITIVAPVADPSKFYIRFGTGQGSAVSTGADMDLINRLTWRIARF